MTDKAAFNAEEWATIVNAPALVATLVIAADRGGTVRESLAAQRAYQEALAKEPGELLRAVLTTPAALDPAARPDSPEDLRRVAPETLRRAIALLEDKALDQEVVEYKRFVYGMADSVARAHREGGFLGIGGTQVSEHEQAALDEIAAIFDERQSVRGDVDSGESRVSSE
jgi:hypothetical protein